MGVDHCFRGFKAQKRFDLRQFKAQIFGTADKLYKTDTILAIKPVSSIRATFRMNQTQLLVIADCVGAHTALWLNQPSSSFRSDPTPLSTLQGQSKFFLIFNIYGFSCHFFTDALHELVLLHVFLVIFD